MTFRADHCLSCGSPDLEFRSAIVSPFVAALALKRAPSVCRLALCLSCGFLFFEDRYDEQEGARLYADYRSEAYYRLRHSLEPWYTRSFNEGLGGEHEMAERRGLYRRTIQDHAAAAPIETVLDYGGDRGQLIAGGPGAAHYVFDISGVAPDPGVTRIPNIPALGDRTFDLVTLCEVLEHVSEPVKLLRDVVTHVRPGGLLYITVPNREFQPGDIPVARWYTAYLKLVLRSRWITLAADFWSTGFRVKFRRIPPLGFAKMHEHINFFDAASLARILHGAGLETLACHSFGNERGLMALCRLHDPQS